MARCRAGVTRAVISSEVDGVLDTVASIHSKLTGENGDEAVLESLRQLQALPMTFRVLEATKIGRVVNALRKSASSEPARELASALYRSWKNLADEHFRRSRLPASEPSGISEQKLEATASPPEAPPKAAATKSATCSFPTKAKPPRGPSPSASRRKEGSPTSSKDTATVSTQPSAATRKAEQPDNAAIRQRAAAVPKPAPASSSKSSGSDKEASPAAPKTIKIVIKRPAPKVQLLPAADAPPPEPNRSKRKEAPTAASMDEARLAAAKRRLKEGYKQAADAKEKRRIQVIGVPGKATKRSAPGAMK
jgi:hypothetical protein